MKICNTVDRNFILFSFKRSHSQLLDILKGTGDIHSRVPIICVAGTDDMPQRYCIPHRNMKVCLMGFEDLPHGSNDPLLGYLIFLRVLQTCVMRTDDLSSSQIVNIFTTTACPQEY